MTSTPAQPHRSEAGGDPMRVAVVATAFPVPSETFVIHHVRGLIERGHRVDVVADPIPPSPGAAAEVHDVADLEARIYRRRALPSSLARRIPAAIDLVRTAPDRRAALRCLLPARRDLTGSARGTLGGRLLHAAAAWRSLPPPEVVLCHFGMNGAEAVALRDRGVIPPVPIVTVFHGYDATVLPAAGAVDYTDLFARGDRFTANTQFLRDRLIDLGCPADRISILRMGVSLSEDRPALREPGEPLRLVTVARLSEEKGVLYGIAAVARLRAGGVDLHWDLIGDGPDRPLVERALRDAGLEGVVTLHGWLSEPDVHRALARAHVYLAPNIVATSGRVETQGVALQEALTAALPVVSTTVGGIPEGVLDGENALLVAPRNPEALATSLASLAADEPRRRAMGLAGREFARHYDLDLANDALVTILRNETAT